jgi:lipoate-protein ligase A
MLLGRFIAPSPYRPIGLMTYYLWASPLPRPGWLNMAIDTALLERAQAGERWVRLYAWEPTLSFGRHEPVERRYDSAIISGLGLAVVRRPTGGRAVWHADELTYAVAAPVNDVGSLQEAYRGVHEWLRAALRSLGAPAELAPRARAVAVDGGACFASSAGGEVVVGGRKVVGSAQLRQGTAMLQHGSILLDGDQSLVARVTRGSAPTDGSMTLRQAVGRPVSWQETDSAVCESVRAAWGTAAVPAPALIDQLLARAEAAGARYRSERWIWAGAAAG